MQVNLKSLVSMTEANQNFSKVTKLVDENGVAVILKNNVPRYVVIEYSRLEENENADDQMVEDIAEQILTKHIKAFEELAK
ncbi:type II toxin-antitoxin system Phd/YefM family antitoxin [Lacrimispora sp.]|uniref:type II toxin-antitoxin system Phd/YefM family antitoxin n=1 Tax=Lacrimispora sp. TaxID=2719234 RepID=UPI00345F2B3A